MHVPPLPDLATTLTPGDRVLVVFHNRELTQEQVGDISDFLHESFEGVEFKILAGADEVYIQRGERS